MYRYAKRRFGEVPEPFAVPRITGGCWPSAIHETMLNGFPKLPVNVREIAVYWTARKIGCSWCVDFGAMMQRLDGLDLDRLKDIDNYATSPRYSDDERAAIRYADAMTTDPHTVTDEQVADLRRRFGDAGVIELTYQIGVENMRARMNTALGITEQGFNSGDACRVPWADETSRTEAELEWRHARLGPGAGSAHGCRRVFRPRRPPSPRGSGHRRWTGSLNGYPDGDAHDVCRLVVVGSGARHAVRSDSGPRR